MLTHDASRGFLFGWAFIVGLSTLSRLGCAAPAIDVDVVLSSLPLPPHTDPATFTLAAPAEEIFTTSRSQKRLALGMPVAGGDLRSGFGLRLHPILGFSKMHTGVDWVTRIGAPIMAAGAGTVIWAEWAAGYGLRVEIQHADAVVTTYSHMSRLGADISPGTEVHQGQEIGALGSTGLSTGPHLHFEVMVKGQFIDPMSIYGPEGVAIKPEKTTSPVGEQAGISPSHRVAEPQPLQSPPVKISATLAVQRKKPSGRQDQLGRHARLQRTLSARRQHNQRKEMWAEFDRRMRLIESKVTASTLKIMR